MLHTFAIDLSVSVFAELGVVHVDSYYFGLGGLDDVFDHIWVLSIHKVELGASFFESEVEVCQTFAHELDAIVAEIIVSGSVDLSGIEDEYWVDLICELEGFEKTGVVVETEVSSEYEDCTFESFLG